MLNLFSSVTAPPIIFQHLNGAGELFGQIMGLISAGEFFCAGESSSIAEKCPLFVFHSVERIKKRQLKLAREERQNAAVQALVTAERWIGETWERGKGSGQPTAQSATCKLKQGASEG